MPKARPRVETATASPNAIAMLTRFKRETAWTDAHWDELLEHYKGQWIAVAGQQVVAAHPDYRQVLQELKPLDLLGTANVVYVTDEEDRFIGPA